MTRRLSLTIGLYLLPFPLALTSLVAQAQSGPDIFVTPIPNVPFSGLVMVLRSIVQPDGSGMEMKTARQIGRDSRGRIYNEARTLVPVSSSQPSQIERIRLYDPQTRVSTMLTPADRTFSSMTVNRPPATVPPALDATPAGNILQPSEFTAKEDLGIQEVSGVSDQGVRQVQKISADGSGTGREVTVTDEYWYSDDLRINLLIRRSDLRTGSTTLTVTKIQRAEPDPALFEIPSDYHRAGTQK